MYVCVYTAGQSILHWRATFSDVAVTRNSLLRIKLLVGCAGLIDDVGRFHGTLSFCLSAV